MQKIRVFVSSTYLDNERRRRVVEDAILSASQRYDHISLEPVMMERFTAGAQPTVDACVSCAQESGLYIGIIARRYGWQPDPPDGPSITEMEYDAARCDRLMFELDPRLPVSEEVFDPGRDRWKKQDLLEAFREKFRADQMPCHFRDDTLGLRLFQALLRWVEKTYPSQSSKPSSPVHPKPITDTALADYFDDLRKKHGTIRLAGFKQLRVPLELTELYVPLRAIVSRSVDGRPSKSAKEAMRRYGSSGEEVELSLKDAFWRGKRWGDHRGLVLLGDPGSGKTTQLKRLLLWIVDEGPEAFALEPKTLPVFLPLRDLKDFETGFRPFARKVLGKSTRGHPGLAEQILDSGRLLFLIDGLDEVPTGVDRRRVASWIQGALDEDFPDSRFVVSSRYAGYGKAERFDASFLELHLRPLGQEQSQAFIRNWHRIVETAALEDPGERAAAEEQAAGEAETLIGRLNGPGFRSARVAEMTENPLLLTAICLVNKDRGHLPQRRVELYHECVQVLLETWREAKRIPVTVSASQARQVLQPMALWLHEQEGQRTRAKESELTRILDPELSKRGSPIESASHFLETIRDESGLLVGWGDGSFGFLHLGFQEYLAAREIRARSIKDPSVIQRLAERFGESWWREVTLLLVALEEPCLFEEYARSVVEQPAFGRHGDWVDDLIEDAGERNARPFLDLLHEEHSGDRELEQRQRMALTVVRSFAPEEAERLEVRFVGVEVWSRSRPREEFETFRTETGGVEMIWVPAGSFWMGTRDDEDEAWSYDDEKPQHRVQVSRFAIGRYPVTNAEYGRFLEANPKVDRPAYWSDRRLNGAQQPVVGVSWDEARAFCRWVGGRLPTEAEWEYACRARTQTRWWCGDDPEALPEVAWFAQNGDDVTHPVGQKPANPWGLHDVHGNVLEWCADWFGPYENEEQHDPAGPSSGSGRVVRGGDYGDVAGWCRSAFRFWYLPYERGGRVGFRVAWPAPARPSNIDP